MMRPLSLVAIGAVVGSCASAPPSAGAFDPQPRGASQHTVAEGHVDAMPSGAAFVSVLALPQPAGATLGPHQHVPGFTYGLRGVATVAFADGPTVDVGAGDAVFTPANVLHLHSNERGRPAAIALGLILVGGVIALAVLSQRAWRWTPLWLVGLIAVGAIGAAQPTENEWYFIAVRPESARGGTMPVPAARRTHESADLEALGSAPFVERLDAFAIEAGGRTAAHRSDGSETIIVLDGSATICVAGTTRRLGPDEALTVQPKTPLQLLNAGSVPLHVIRFSVRPEASQAEALVESSPC